MEDSSNRAPSQEGRQEQVLELSRISLLNIGVKIPEAVLKNRLEPAYERVARKNQAGFKRNKGCRDQIFTIRHQAEQRYQYDRQTLLVFIDFKAAFDRVVRNVICLHSREPWPAREHF